MINRRHRFITLGPYQWDLDTMPAHARGFARMLAECERCGLMIPYHGTMRPVRVRCNTQAATEKNIELLRVNALIAAMPSCTCKQVRCTGPWPVRFSSAPYGHVEARVTYHYTDRACQVTPYGEPG